MEEIFFENLKKNEKSILLLNGEMFCAGDAGSDQSVDCVFIKDPCYSLYFSNLLFLYSWFTKGKKVSGVWSCCILLCLPLTILEFLFSFLCIEVVWCKNLRESSMWKNIQAGRLEYTVWQE